MTLPLRIVLAGGMAVSATTVLQQAVQRPIELICIPTYDVMAVADAVADAAMMIGPRFSAEMAVHGVGLKLFQVTGAGLDRVDLAALPEHTVVCTVSAHSTAMAEYAIMALLGLTRRLVPMDRLLRNGDWTLGGAFGAPPGGELRHRTLCVVGMGEAVRELIPLARAFGMRVVAVRRRLDAAGSANSPADHVYAREELGDALAEADYVVIAVPLNEETRGMIGAAELARLRPTAMLVNMARDAVVDEAALYDALQSARIAGAAIDVWSRSPADATTKLLPSPYPFQDLDNVIVTPHVAGWTQGTLEGRWRIIAENVRRLIDGEALLNMIGRGRRVPEP